MALSAPKVERRKKAEVKKKGGKMPSQHPIRNLQGSRRTAKLEGKGWDDLYKAAQAKIAQETDWDKIFPEGMGESAEMEALVKSIGEFYQTVDPSYFEDYDGGIDEWVKDRTSNPLLTAQTLRAYATDPGVRSPLVAQLALKVQEAATPGGFRKEFELQAGEVEDLANQMAERKYRTEDIAGNVIAPGASMIHPVLGYIANFAPDIRAAWFKSYEPEKFRPEKITFERAPLKPYMEQAVAELKYMKAMQKAIGVEERLAAGIEVPEAEAKAIAAETAATKQAYEDITKSAPPLTELYDPATTKKFDWGRAGTRAMTQTGYLTSLGLSSPALRGKPGLTRALGRHAGAGLLSGFHAYQNYQRRNEQLKYFLRDHVRTFATHDDGMIGKALLNNMRIGDQFYEAGTVITPAMQETLADSGVDRMAVGDPIPTAWVAGNWGATGLDFLGSMAASRAFSRGVRGAGRALPGSRFVAGALQKGRAAGAALNRVTRAGRMLAAMGRWAKQTKAVQAAARWFASAKTADDKMTLLARLAKRGGIWGKIAKGLRLSGKTGSKIIKSIPVVGQLVNIGFNTWDAAFGSTTAGTRESDELLQELWKEQMTQPGWKYWARSLVSIPEAYFWDTKRLRTHMQDIGLRLGGLDQQRTQFIRKYQENEAIMEEYADRALPELKKLLPGMDPKLLMNAAAEMAVNRVETRKGKRDLWRQVEDFETLALSKDSPYLEGLNLTEKQRVQAVKLNRLIGPDAFMSMFYFQDESTPGAPLRLDAAAWDSLKKGVDKGATVQYGFGKPMYRTKRGGVTEHAAGSGQFLGYDDKTTRDVRFTVSDEYKRRETVQSRRRKIERTKQEEAAKVEEAAKARQREEWEAQRAEWEKEQADWDVRHAQQQKDIEESRRRAEEAEKEYWAASERSGKALQRSFERSMERWGELAARHDKPREAAPAARPRTPTQLAPPIKPVLPEGGPGFGAMMAQDYAQQPQLDQQPALAENVPTAPKVTDVLSDLQQKGVF